MKIDMTLCQTYTPNPRARLGQPIIYTAFRRFTGFLHTFADKYLSRVESMFKEISDSNWMKNR